MRHFLDIVLLVVLYLTLIGLGLMLVGVTFATGVVNTQLFSYTIPVVCFDLTAITLAAFTWSNVQLTWKLIIELKETLYANIPTTNPS